MKVSALEAPLSEDAARRIAALIEDVEIELRRRTDSDVRVVREIAGHTLDAGGKRLRPVLVSLAADATGLPYDRADAVRLGAVLEIIHMATLIHDDVIDRSATRRGRPTASSLYGTTPSILSGDVLLARSMHVLAEHGDLAIIRAVSAAVVEMAEGEVAELERRGDFELSQDDHMRVLYKKTAAFIECACRLGGLVARAEASVVEALAEYGKHVGLAFQIIDDVLDFRGRQEATGKPTATDFREACATLPLILLRPSLSDDESQFVRSKFGNGVTEDELRAIGSWMEERGAFAGAESLAAEHMERARLALERIPESPASRLLAEVGDFVLKREQ